MLLEGAFEGLPSLLSVAPSRVPSPARSTRPIRKLATWDWVMNSDALKYYVVCHCITPSRRARRLEQLKENAEWKKAFGRL